MEMTQSIQIEEGLTRHFDPASAIIFSTFDVEEHYNVVMHAAEPMRQALAELSAELATFKELAVVQPNNYHSTVLAFPLSKNAVLKPENMPTLCRQSPSLVVKGLHIRPNAICVNTYSPDGALGHMRAALAAYINVPFDARSRLANIGWISLARFVGQPTPQLVAFVQNQVARDFGTFTTAPSLHKSKSRQQLGLVIWQT